MQPVQRRKMACLVAVVAVALLGLATPISGAFLPQSHNLKAKIRHGATEAEATSNRRIGSSRSSSSSGLSMVMNPHLDSPDNEGKAILRHIQASVASAVNPGGSNSDSSSGRNRNRNRRRYNSSKNSPRYKRKTIPETELKARRLYQQRQKQYEQLIAKHADGDAPPSIWSFESLFPAPFVDEQQVDLDLYEVQRRDSQPSGAASAAQKKGKSNAKQLQQQQQRFAATKSSAAASVKPTVGMASTVIQTNKKNKPKNSNPLRFWTSEPKLSAAAAATATPRAKSTTPAIANMTTTAGTVDRTLTRLVQDRLYGYQRTAAGDFEYETSLLDRGNAVQFKEGVRLGNPLAVNADRLNYMAKKELQRGRVEEAAELYQQAVEIDARDGRAYLGLSRCAQRRRDFKLAREWLQAGIRNSASQQKVPVVVEDDNTAGGSSRSKNGAASASTVTSSVPDRGANPFLLQALGQLEEMTGGNLAEAEALYIAAAKSRPSHAAAWVALAQLRTRKLGQSAAAGRQCYQAAERELQRAGQRPSAYVYTAWAALEYGKARQTKRARELFQKALKVDPQCSAAWLQLGVLESDCENWKEAAKCFETVLKFDQRNSRVLQAYAIMETKRPDGDSRKAIDLFERAVSVNPRDAGVLQAYALYVSQQLGDYQAARNMLKRGTEVDKRHAPVWQAWGVLETRHGTPQEARSVFQQGIWACASSTGNQSGGHKCARLWQAWGVLEAAEGNHAAARRCFSRALDANSRNVPAITAWALMEEQAGNESDARSIFERALRRFAAGSEEKMSLWRNYELMERRLDNLAASQKVYQRAMRETITIGDDEEHAAGSVSDTKLNKRAAEAKEKRKLEEVLKKSDEVEVLQWTGGSGGEVWLNDRFIESRLPFGMKQRNARQ